MTQREPASAVLDRIFQGIARQIAQGTNTDPRDMLPGAADPLEGLVPDPYRPETESYDWFDSAAWYSGPPETPVDFSKLPVGTGQGTDGDGLDWFRSSEAPNNLGNRHHPLYQARRQFALNMAQKIGDLFDVSDQGSAGYLRPFQASHAEPGGPSANSDHYSGGAVDFFGTPEELTELRDWLIRQPFTSFVRWQSESHYDHLHVSFDLGWVGQNFYEGQPVPPVYRTPAASLADTAGSQTPISAATPPQRRTEEATRSITGGGVQVL